MENYQGGMPEGPGIPGEQDIPGIIHNVTMTYGRWAPPSIGMPAIQMGHNFLAGTASYQKGALEAARLQRETALANMTIVNSRMKDLLRRYSEVFEDYGPGIGKDYNAQKFDDAIRAVAQKYNDQTVLDMIGQQDWGAVERHLKNLHNNSQDLQKVGHQLDNDLKRERLKAQEEKDAAAEAMRKQYLGTPTPDQASPAPTGAPAAGAAPAAPPSGVSGRPLASPQIMAIGQATLMGEKPFIPKDPAIQTAAEQYTENLRAYMNHLADADNGMTPAQVKAEIKAANPSMATTVEDLMQGHDVGVVAGSKPTMIMATALARRLDKNYDENARRLRDQRLMQSRQAQARPLAADLTTLERQHSQIAIYVPKNVHDMANLQQIADRLKARGLENQIPMLNRLYRQGLREFSGDPDLSAYMAQLVTVRGDSGRIMSASASGTGLVSVHTQQEAEKLWDSALTADQLRGVITTMKRDYSNRIGPVTEQLNNVHGRLAEVYHDTAPKAVDDSAIESALTADDVRTLGGKTYYLRNGHWFDE
jgi:hypothetical protein